LLFHSLYISIERRGTAFALSFILISYRGGAGGGGERGVLEQSTYIPVHRLPYCVLK
jgi:hypothetical protein